MVEIWEAGMVFKQAGTWSRTAERDAAWQHAGFGGQAHENFARDEAQVRRGFWSKARRVGARLPFAEDLLAAYFCAFDRNTPVAVRTALIGALAYFVVPFDGVPDILPVLGFADDAAILATAIRLVASNISADHRSAARAAIARGLRE
jgi:uncharacterized membrane protein YkvA (DUF1232 family)